MTDPPRPYDGVELYRTVERYAGFGAHHSGTEADRATTAWLVDTLTGIGAITTRRPYDFLRYDATESLTLVGGETVPTVPVFYSAVGDHRTDRLEVVSLDRALAGPAAALDAMLTRDDERALVLALDGPDDLPVQVNRVPWPLPASGRVEPPPTGRPAVVIPGNWADRVRDGAELVFSAGTEPSSSANVVAELGPVGGPPVTVTTPLTGWTPAAGERGTGLAVALDLMAELATDHRVTFVGCSGHEIDHIGLQHHLGSASIGGPVIHLGASVAAVEWRSDASAALGPNRLVLTTAEEPTRSEIANLARPGNWRLVDPEVWQGEGANWRRAGAGLGVEVLSFIGSFALFHVADDLPERATTPAALATAAEVCRATVRRFLAR